MDINCDMGEVSESWYSGYDKQILKYITSINISCGAHAGTETLILDTVREALKLKLRIGAHPSFPDSKNFGRKVIEMPLPMLKQSILEQVMLLKVIVEKEGGKLHHIKPHGALYNLATYDTDVASMLIGVVKEIDETLILYCPSGSMMEEESSKMGIKVWREAFVDRNYAENGSLVNRSNKNALITNPQLALNQVKNIVNFKLVKSLEGQILPMEADTFCVHGDGPTSVEIAETLSNYFSDR